MNTLSLVISVINRSQQKEFIEFFHQYHSHIVYSTPCHGTTKHAFLQYLGLEVTEKLLLVAIIDTSLSSSLLASMLYDMELDHAGNGICLIIPIHSICNQSLKYYESLSPKVPSKAGGTKMDVQPNNHHNTSMYELIIAIANSGYTDLVMDAARNASASGGTVIHAKSTATEQMRKFLGISIVEEKEILLIVSKQEQKAGIMKEIQKAAGTHTPAGTIIFSVPVDSVAGLHFYPDTIKKESAD